MQKQLEVVNESLLTERSQIDTKIQEYKRLLEAKIAAKDEVT